MLLHCNLLLFRRRLFLGGARPACSRKTTSSWACSSQTRETTSRTRVEVWRSCTGPGSGREEQTEPRRKVRECGCVVTCGENCACVVSFLIGWAVQKANKKIACKGCRLSLLTAWCLLVQKFGKPTEKKIAFAKGLLAQNLSAMRYSSERRSKKILYKATSSVFKFLESSLSHFLSVSLAACSMYKNYPWKSHGQTACFTCLFSSGYDVIENGKNSLHENA